jgi:hypothetical protein
MPIDTSGWERKAIEISERIQQQHTPFKTILDPQVDAPASMVLQHYARAGDSAIWTGHYLAAEAFRYKVTASNAAFKNLQRTLEGLQSLVDITGTGLLARCLFPEGWEFAAAAIREECRHGIRPGTVNGEKYLWVGNTSRDQYSGVFFGLTVAWNLVDDQQVRDWVSMLATRMLNRLLEDFWLVRMPEGEITTTFLGRPDQQLSLLKLGRRCNPSRFESNYRALSNFAAPGVLVPILLETQELHDSYFKFNLDHINMYNLLTSGDSWWLKLHYTAAFDALRSATESHENAFFDMIDTAINGPRADRDERVRKNLAAWLQRSRRDLWTDLRPDYVACGDNRGCEVIPVERRTPTDFLWQRSPFQLYGGLYGTIGSAGIDYILPYWMARQHGVIVD